MINRTNKSIERIKNNRILGLLRVYANFMGDYEGI